MSLLLPLFNLLAPESAHNFAIFLLKKGIVPKCRIIADKALEVRALGLIFKNPVGLAAGFDKNAECLKALSEIGFGFLEAGTVTLQPQKGNTKPRIFRLTEDEAIVNRLGFNNKGIANFLNNLNNFNSKNGKKNIQEAEAHSEKLENADFLPIGVNIGKNKGTINLTSDYVNLAEKVVGKCDYIVLNISSPNTARLRDLQKAELLKELLTNVFRARERIQGGASYKTPILIKIAPDINDGYKSDMVALALEYNVDGIILTNTTIGCRKHLKSKAKVEYGGLSGKPLFSLSTQNLKEVYKETKGKIILIGCGGIFSAQDAYIKIKSGASLVQIYTVLVYKGLSVIEEINKGLIELLRADGFANISEAIGKDL